MNKHKHPAKRAIVVPPTPICFGKEIAARLACAVDVCLAATLWSLEHFGTSSGLVAWPE